MVGVEKHTSTCFATHSNLKFIARFMQGNPSSKVFACLLKPKFIDTQLKGMTGSWPRGQGDITLKDYHEYRRVLTQAHLSGVQFRKATVKATLWRVEKKYTFFYHHPWEWIRSLVTDPSLASVTTWKSRWNGGGVFLGFMVMVKDPGNPMDCTDKENYEFAQFKREIHQQVLEIIFSSLYLRSWRSEVVTCEDEITRVLYPGFLIESLNFEEAWNFTCCRAGRGKFPSPRCLVSHEMLHFLQRTFEACTSSNMRAIHFMWNFRFSDPYQAVSYNLLYFNESGKWGHHLWPLIRDLLRELHLLTEMTDIMSKFPRWRNLKHIDDLATKDFTDGQTHSDILKRVSKDYNKNFRFPKRHFIVHAVQDIWSKGVL
ncbi:hypothetical protein B0H14DRAFT_2566266 [Mycena olivaceomarginata]|nr:hypothetical protein B0H14DRAFT_2566266 [Mycena olivaceomarginata]